MRTETVDDVAIPLIRTSSRLTTQAIFQRAERCDVPSRIASVSLPSVSICNRNRGRAVSESGGLGLRKGKFRDEIGRPPNQGFSVSKLCPEINPELVLVVQSQNSVPELSLIIAGLHPQVWSVRHLRPRSAPFVRQSPGLSPAVPACQKLSRRVSDNSRMGV